MDQFAQEVSAKLGPVLDTLAKGLDCDAIIVIAGKPGCDVATAMVMPEQAREVIAAALFSTANVLLTGTGAPGVEMTRMDGTVVNDLRDAR